MKRNKIILLCTVLVSLLGICFPLENMFYLLLYGCIMILILSLLQALCLHGKITTSLQIERGIIEKGEEAVCKIVSENRSRFLNGWVTMRVASPFLSGKGKKVMQQADAKERVESSVTFLPEYAGIYKVQAVKRRVTDIFGLLHIPVKKCADTWFVVLPKVHSVNSIFMQETMISKNHPFEPSLSHEVRKYQNGDSMKRVHWKISAKERELYTRIEEGEEKPLIQVFMDTRQIPEKGVKYLEIRDKMIETTLSVIYGWYQAGYRVQVSWESDGVKVREVRDEYQWHQVYQEIAKIEFDSTLDMDAWCSCQKTARCSYIVHNPGFAFYTKVAGTDHVWVIGGTNNGASGKTVPLFEDIQEL